jgi:hypothetical protein
MLSDCISDNVARIKEGVDHYVFEFNDIYSSKIILRTLKACDILDQIRAELDASDIEDIKQKDIYPKKKR